MSMYGDENPMGEARVSGESMTKQSFAEEADINVIYARAIRNGLDPRLLPGAVEAQYADVSAVGDFADAQGRLLKGQQIFAELSAEDRLSFGNDAGNFFQFAADPANEEAVCELRFGEKGVAALRAHRRLSSGGGVSDPPGRDPGTGGPAAGKPDASGGDKATSKGSAAGA